MPPNDEPHTPTSPDPARTNVTATTASPPPPPHPATPPGEKPGAHEHADGAGLRVMSLGMTGLVALICGMGGAYLYMQYLVKSPYPTPAAAAAQRAGGGDAARADRTDSASAASAETRDRLDGLVKKVDALQKQTEVLAHKNGIAPEVASLQVRVADLTDATNTLEPLPGKVEHLNNRLSDLSGTLTAVRDAVDSLQSRAGGTTRLASSAAPPREAPGSGDDPAAKPKPTTTPTPIPDNRRADAPKAAHEADPAALAAAAKLFRRGRYAEARDAFGKLEAAEPDDARVWYYAALSYGFATGDWNDGAARLAEKGVACEEAGSPTPSKIDAEFKDLASANGKDWLAAYRNRVKSAGPR